MDRNKKVIAVSTEEVVAALILVAELDPDRYTNPATKSLVYKSRHIADEARRLGGIKLEFG